MTDLVNHPPHYTVGGMEVIDVLKAKLSRDEYLGYLKGNTLKYILRMEHKGATDNDAKKALWYWTRYVDERCVAPAKTPAVSLTAVKRAMDTTPQETADGWYEEYVRKTRARQTEHTRRLEAWYWRPADEQPSFLYGKI